MHDATEAVQIDSTKFILDALFFFMKNTAKWAKWYTEEATDNKVIFLALNIMRPFSIEF